MKKMLFILAAALSLAACGGSGANGGGDATLDPDRPVSSDDPTPTPPPTPDPNDVTFGEAQVDAVDILILESFPLQVQAAVSGNLPDGCTQIHQAEVVKDGDIFNVALSTVRPIDVECTEALVPYEKNVSLDVYGLPAGTYKVNVNGVIAEFTFNQDNILPTDQPGG